MQKKKLLLLCLIIFTLLGMMDAGYLTFEHYNNVIPPCSINIPFADCGKVLTSTYSMVLGIPLALIGLLHYTFFTGLLIFIYETKNRYAKYLAFLLSWAGFLASCYFVYLQIAVIHAICIFCMTSALTSTLVFITAQIVFKNTRKRIFLALFGWKYRTIIKPILFQIDPVTIHETATKFGEFFGKFSFTKWLTRAFFGFTDTRLKQTVAGITFTNPIGLAAGFDYEARLTQILPAVGFGFQSVGTITNMAYKGNPKPMLGRLPKSQSLMVNKGFKNEGASVVAKRLAKLQFATPIGISIGRTNGLKGMTQKQSVEDICRAFKTFEKAKVDNAYYELNISCPNLYGDISFYPPEKLEELLKAVDRLNLSKPLFVKMPIEKSDSEVLSMLRIIAKHSPVGVVFGNLQKDRTSKLLDKSELAKFPVGNFSGKPTYLRSNELIKLTYKNYKKRLIIIGCGGVFNAKDAFTKITLGASLIQMITGMIYMGPGQIATINMELITLLQKHKFASITEAIGANNK